MAIAFTEFYGDATNGSNLYGGSGSGVNAGASGASGPTMTDTAGTATWAHATLKYTSVATNGAVAVGQWLSIYTSGATSPTTCARITAVSGGGGSVWQITVSGTSYIGTAPGSVSDGSTYLGNVGGDFAGPTGTVAWPLVNSFGATATDANGDPPRFNMKNNATYSITAAITWNSGNSAPPTKIQGYSSTPGDGGRAVIDGGTSGTAYTLLNMDGCATLQDLIFQHNGASGSATGLNVAGGNEGAFLKRVTVNNVRGSGFALGNSVFPVAECEAYACNLSNGANQAGFVITGNPVQLVRCYSHDNTGGNNSGFYSTARNIFFNRCIADSNGQYGFLQNNSSGSQTTVLLNCDSYNNGSDGFNYTGAATAGNSSLYVENCNFVSNGGYGVNGSQMTNVLGQMVNCGFYNNTSGPTHTLGILEVVGSITYASSPYNSPSTGDFTISLAAAQGAGDGNFTESGASKTFALSSYTDVGAVQHTPAASGPVGQQCM